MSKIEELNEWLDKQEAHHRKGSSNIVEEVFADVMKLVKTRLKNTNWNDIKIFIEDYANKPSHNMVGVNALIGAYKKIYQKMKSLDWKESK